MQSLKNTKATALLRGAVFLIPLFLILPQWYGAEGIWLAMSIIEMLTLLATIAIRNLVKNVINHNS